MPASRWRRFGKRNVSSSSGVPFAGEWRSTREFSGTPRVPLTETRVRHMSLPAIGGLVAAQAKAATQPTGNLANNTITAVCDDTGRAAGHWLVTPRRRLRDTHIRSVRKRKIRG